MRKSVGRFPLVRRATIDFKLEWIGTSRNVGLALLVAGT